MKVQITKAVASMVIVLGIGAGFLVWYPFPFSLAWPGLILARLGIPHSWLFAVALMLGLLVWLGLRSRSKAWWQVVAAGLAVPAVYCTVAFIFVARLPVPMPSGTPYEANSAQRTAYLQSYESGYRDGMVGFMRTYCFYSKAETRGFYEGSFQGSKVWYRLLGRQVPERHRSLMQSSAGIDGVQVDVK